MIQTFIPLTTGTKGITAQVANVTNNSAGNHRQRQHVGNGG